MIEKERKLAAEWIVAQSILGELITNNFSKEKWEELKDSGLLNGKISFVTWERYWKENGEERALKFEAMNPVDNLKTKIGNVFDKRELAEHIIEAQPCFYDKVRNWWLWNYSETKWERVDETDILNAVDKEADINTINSKEKSEMIEALKQVSRLNAPLPIQPTWIQFKDKILNIEDGVEITATPRFFVTNPIPWELNDDGFHETPKLDEIFEEWVGKDHVQTLYEILAYCLIPDYPIHRIFCLIGGGMNGKSKFLEVLRKFIGKANCCSIKTRILLKKLTMLRY